MNKIVENKEDYCSVCQYGENCKDRYDPKVRVRVIEGHSIPKDKSFWCTRLGK